MKDHPHLISLYNLYQNEVQSFRKVHRMIDLFESIIKSHTIVILGEYVKHNNLSDAAKGMLAKGLHTPSLGIWQEFSRVLFEELQAGNYSWTFAEFPADFIALKKKLKDTDVIAFRNSYAHGATPTDSQCLVDIQKFEPFLNILHKSNWLSTTRIETRESKVWIVGDNEELCVHPLLVNKSDGGETPYAFFNDLKKDKVGLLNYPLSKHYREKDFLSEFYEYLPINEWKKSGNNEHHQHIEELTETFKGRTNEREKLLNFVSENNKGYCSIQGNPGIGKSALIAQFFKDMRAQKEITNVHVVEYFIRRGTIQSQNIEYMFNYLIRRTDEIFIQGKEIRAEGKDIWDLQQQLFAKWRLWGEQCAGKKLLFLIDGLDEGTENNIVKYLPRENFLGVLIIYGSRPGGHKSLEELWSELPTENHTKLELSGLSLEDIRALIYEVANKYELERESAWIDAVQKRSQGNPLYLKLLCAAIENGSIELNDIHALPEKIDEYYKAILARYAADTLDGDALLAGLYTFAAARDYLTLAHIKFINKLGDATVHRIGSTLKEVLYENPLTETVLDYQLFHESFREYLVEEKAREVSDAAERIIDFCSTWQDHEGNWELRYCLQHYAAHATVSSRKARASELLMLLGNTEYIETQKKVLKHYDATKELFQLCLLKASELKLYDPQLEAALRLIDLKYEEANDAPKVIALVASGNPDDLELALKRIESFGGADNEGVKRRFILYMLCLMELTLLGSKEAPFRNDTIAKLLKHLDEQIPVDNSIINWNEFFPSYTMFLMACEWAELGLNYLIIYKRTSEWENKCLNQNGPYTNFQFDVWFKCAQVIADEYGKYSALMDISIELSKQERVEKAIEIVRDIPDEYAWLKNTALINVSTELATQGKIKQAFESAESISSDVEKCSALKGISSELTKLGNLKEATYAINQALLCANKIDVNIYKNSALSDISIELAKQGRLEQAIEIVRYIPNEDGDYKFEALKDISREVAKIGQIEQALEYAYEINSDYFKCITLIDISCELAKQMRKEESESTLYQALGCARKIKHDYFKCLALIDISSEQFKQEKKVDSSVVMHEAFECALAFSPNSNKIIVLKKIANELFKQGNNKEAEPAIAQAIKCALEKQIEDFRDIYWRDQELKNIADELSKLGMIKESLTMMEKILESFRGISSNSHKLSALKNISNELHKHGKKDVAVFAIMHASIFANKISSDFLKAQRLIILAKELAKLGKIEQSLEFADSIGYKNLKNKALFYITLELLIKGKKEQVFECVRIITEVFWKSNALMNIYLYLSKKGKHEDVALVKEEALKFWKSITIDSQKITALLFYSKAMFKQGKIKTATSAINQALELAKSMVDSLEKNEALIKISKEMAKQGKIDQAFECAQCISNIHTTEYTNMSHALKNIVRELAKEGMIEQAIECARDITDKYDNFKSEALKDISSELIKQSNWEYAEKIGFEITQLAVRQSCWKNIAGINYKEVGWQKSLQQFTCLRTDEARIFYLKGWVEAVDLYEVNSDCVKEALSIIANDSESIETLLQKHALHEVFLSNTNTEKINQLNHSLNIQWMLDIANQFPNSNSKTRLSTNVETWLHEIADEDDRERVELWAMKVSKGTMNEEEFKLKLEKITFI